MQKSEQIDELAAALAKAQGVLPAVVKSQKATVKGESRSGKPYEYTYRYATLDAVWDCCRKPLSDNGLSVAQVILETADGHPQIETILLHASGQWLSSLLPLTATADPQQMGSQITYYRRYALSALVGIVTDEDDDGPAARDAPRQATQERPRPQKQPVSSPTAQTPSEGSTDTPDALAAFLAEARPYFAELPVDQQARILKKYGNAPSLEKVLPQLRHHVLSEVVDLTATS